MLYVPHVTIIELLIQSCSEERSRLSETLHQIVVGVSSVVEYYTVSQHVKGHLLLFNVVVHDASCITIKILEHKLNEVLNRVK